MDGRTDGRTDGWMDESVEGQMDRRFIILKYTVVVYFETKHHAYAISNTALIFAVHMYACMMHGWLIIGWHCTKEIMIGVAVCVLKYNCLQAHCY